MSDIEQFRVTAGYLREQGLSQTFPARFFSKVQITQSCWLWTGYRMAGRSGQPFWYGQIQRGARGLGVILTHRASWILHYGPIPDGFDVLHDCPDGDCPWCVNPGHLWLGTAEDNTHDMDTKGRRMPNWGEINGTAKLSDRDILQILAMRRRGMTYRAIGRLFHVSECNIGFIITGRSWTHLTGLPRRRR